MNVDDIYEELEELGNTEDADIDWERFNYLQERVAEIEELAPDARRHGLTMISERDFVDYAQQVAEDIGVFHVAVDNFYGSLHRQSRDISNQWPFTCIDWQRAADELAQDYTEIEFDGVTYYCQEV